MAIENVTSPLIDPLIAALHQLLSMLSVLLGGLFGLSVLFFVLRFLHDRKQMRVLRKLQTDMNTIKARLDELCEVQQKQDSPVRGRSHGR